MVKHLQFSKIQAVERRGALMLVWFLDSEGNMYDWSPKWEEVEKIYLKQINVERFNKPESQWLNRFAKTAQQVVEGAQGVESAYKVSGRLQRYEEQKLIIHSQEERLPFDGFFEFLGPRRAQTAPELVTVERRLVPGFEVSLDFLDKWLGADVVLFVVNDIAIKIREYNEFGGLEREYPELEEPSI